MGDLDNNKISTEWEQFRTQIIADLLMANSYEEFRMTQIVNNEINEGVRNTLGLVKIMDKFDLWKHVPEEGLDDRADAGKTPVAKIDENGNRFPDEEITIRELVNLLTDKAAKDGKDEKYTAIVNKPGSVYIETVSTK